MSESQPDSDILSFRLTPIEEDPKFTPEDRARIMQAVKAELARIAKETEIKIREIGEIDPLSRENAERANQIAKAASPMMARSPLERGDAYHPTISTDFGFSRERSSSKITHANGSVEERSTTITRGKGKLRADLKGLNELCSSLSDLVSTVKITVIALAIRLFPGSSAKRSSDSDSPNAVIVRKQSEPGSDKMTVELVWDTPQSADSEFQGTDESEDARQ